MADVILYELNEVPWQIVDLYLARRPDSTLAKVVRDGVQLTTHNPDPAYLQPWRTWPTFHTGLLTEEHGSFELGQDPSTFHGEPVWDAAEAAGLRIGLFGVLQSWPPRKPEHGGFWVPDTFARTPAAVPEALERFQAFNLAMTADNTFSANAPLNAKSVALTGVDLLVRGLTPRSGGLLVKQIVRERRDGRWKAARPMAQVLPAFDLYWRLHKQTKPNLSVFFTNHVAGMMHRYWGDAVEDYSETYGYERDEVFANFLFEAMDLFDAQLGRIADHIQRNPGTTLVIASSMGQAPIAYNEVRQCYVLREPDRLTDRLGLPRSEPGLAMYPRYALQFADPEQAEQAAKKLGELTIEGEELFYEVRTDERTVAIAVQGYHGDGPARLAGEPVAFDQLGFQIEERLGGGNTAHHIPQGIWIAYGTAAQANGDRREFDVREAKGRILELLG